METPLAVVRAFVLQIERSLKARRLYDRTMPPFSDATSQVREKLEEATRNGDFTLRVDATALYLGKDLVLDRGDRKESIFFPLYRDGLRELTFSAGATLDEVDQMLTVLEAESQGKVSPSEDTVSHLWRSSFSHISFSAIDGIGEHEGGVETGASSDEYRSLIADVLSKISNPAPASTGQSYSFLVDADVSVAQTDLRYDATTVRRPFEENPRVMSLTQEEAEALRQEAADQNEADLLARFLDILFFVLNDSSRSATVESLEPLFARILNGYWDALAIRDLWTLLNRLGAVAEKAPLPENRAVARQIKDDFLTTEFLQRSLDHVTSGVLPVRQASAVWELCGDSLWDVMIGHLITVHADPLRGNLIEYLRHRLSSNPDLLRTTLRSDDPEVVHAGLAVLDRGAEGSYRDEMLALASRDDEALRFKAIVAAGRLGGHDALRVLLHAMENDSSRTLRLLAFRVVERFPLPQLANRLRAIVGRPDFARREQWEKEKYVQLLGRVGGQAEAALFESWIPRRRWFWRAKDQHAAELALLGLASSDCAGRTRLQELAAGGGRLARIAQELLIDPRVAKRPNGRTLLTSEDLSESGKR